MQIYITLPDAQKAKSQRGSLQPLRGKISCSSGSNSDHRCRARPYVAVIPSSPNTSLTTAFPTAVGVPDLGNLSTPVRSIRKAAALRCLSALIPECILNAGYSADCHSTVAPIHRLELDIHTSKDLMRSGGHYISNKTSNFIYMFVELCCNVG